MRYGFLVSVGLLSACLLWFDALCFKVLSVVVVMVHLLPSGLVIVVIIWVPDYLGFGTILCFGVVSGFRSVISGCAAQFGCCGGFGFGLVLCVFLAGVVLASGCVA